MPQIRFASLSYSTNNLGDDLQTLSTLPFLHTPFEPFDRDSLARQESDDRYILLMNGWWAADPENAFPPASFFLPVFIGFHLTQSSKKHFSQPLCIDYLKSHAPIGCRDLDTMETLQQWGVDAFFSGCLSTTFDKREQEPQFGKIIMTDTGRVDHLLPPSLKKDALIITHRFNGDAATREKAVYDLLNLYRTSASLVITTRLHAALTCSALGIPVIFFFDPEDPRASTAVQIGLPLYPYFLNRPKWLKKWFKKFKLFSIWMGYEHLYFRIKYTTFTKINWTPGTLNLEKHKSELRSKTKAMVEAVLQRYS